MKNMDKGLNVWVLINRPKIPQIPQKLSAQAQKFGNFDKKKTFIGHPSVLRAANIVLHSWVKSFFFEFSYLCTYI